MRKLCYVLLLLALQAHAETYKWKDKDGNAVSYTHLDVYKRQAAERPV